LPKFALSDDTLVHKGVCLRRIVAVDGLPCVPPGVQGGWVQSPNNLSQTGLCWIGDDAKVYGNALVSGNAVVSGSASVFDAAIVTDSATVTEKASVFGGARVAGATLVAGSALVHGNSHLNDCTVLDHAQVSAFAILGNSVVVRGHATVGGHAILAYGASVGGHAHVDGFVRISAPATISSNAIVTGSAIVSSAIGLALDAYITSSLDYSLVVFSGIPFTFYLDRHRAIYVYAHGSGPLNFNGPLSEFTPRLSSCVPRDRLSTWLSLVSAIEILLTPYAPVHSEVYL